MSRSPATEPGPTTTLTTPSGSPASSASSPKRSAVSGVNSAGLSTTVLPPGQRRRPSFQLAMHEREIPRHDQPDHAQRFAKRHVDAARNRDGVAVVLLDRARA